MVAENDIVTTKARLFIEILKKNGIDVSQAYLFGSASKGLTDKDSDIDLAIVSKDFNGQPYYDIKKISKYRRSVDLRLEIHPFSFSDIQTSPSLFFNTIKKEGIRLQ
ncbi:MAG: nucleotidyltransferase domain-containing protein [Thermodesulfobacteriota bacterium]|nr:nucleotidyltransferase domain-containing protein [Thermodesulfobacteriota bacterium]